MAAHFSLSDCLAFFDDVLASLHAGFRMLELGMPQPKFRARGQQFEVRYQKPSLELALLLKLARAISLLGALRLMVERGMIQEQGILERAIDETDDEVWFLAFGHQNGLEKIHHEFLDAFWAEEFEDPEHILGHARRASISRRKIQAYNNRQFDGGGDPSTAQSIHQVIHGVYSGFVHGASVHILELYDWQHGSFALNGLGNSPVRQSYVVDAANYPFRVICAAILVARRLGAEQIADEFDLKRRAAEQIIGLPSDEEAANLMATMKRKPNLP